MLDIFKKYLLDIENGEFGKLEKIAIFIMGSLSPMIIFLFFFKVDYIQNIEIVKLLLVSITIDYLILFLSTICFLGSELIKQENNLYKRKK